MLEARSIAHAYGGRTILDVPHVALAPGARLALVGPNGSGKSTLLRLLACLEVPTRGTLTLDGRVLGTSAERRAARQRITLVEQRPFLFRGRVLDGVLWPLRLRGMSAPDADRRAREALARLGLEPLMARPTTALSEGEIQRVAVARALALAPDVLLLDEAVSAADHASRHALFAALEAEQRGRPLAIGFASHQLEEAYRWSGELLALHEGVPVPVTPENLFRVDLPGPPGIQPVRVGPVTVDVAADRTGPATLAIPPEEVLLSAEPLHSSARNVLSGRVVRVAEQGASVRVTVDVGVELVALVTRRSFDELGLGLGAATHVAFKTMAVRVF